MGEKNKTISNTTYILSRCIITRLFLEQFIFYKTIVEQFYKLPLKYLEYLKRSMNMRNNHEYNMVIQEEGLLFKVA